MPISHLQPILYALLFSTESALTVKDFQRVFSRYHEEREKELAQIAEGTEEGQIKEEEQEEQSLETQIPSIVTGAQLHDALSEMASDLEDQKAPYRLQLGPNGYRLVVAKDYANWVRLLRNEPRPIRLSPAALETLAIVAYRQPATRAEIEKVRGVSVDSALNKLVELGLIVMIGRADLPGRPTQYATTDKFLELAGLRSLSDLPAIDGLKTDEINNWLGCINEPTQTELPVVLDNAAMGLSPAETTA